MKLYFKNDAGGNFYSIIPLVMDRLGPRLTDKMRAARLKGHSSSLTEEGGGRTRNRRTRGLFSQVQPVFAWDIELERYQAFLLYNVQIRLEGSRKAGSREPK